MTKIGFIGTGSFAKQHAEILQELGVKIVACYGTNPEKTTDFSRRFQCKMVFDPFSLISKDIIDVLYIVIPPFAHDGMVELKAIENKVPFLCEKPVGLNVSVCEKIAKECEATKLITSSGYMLRQELLFDEVKKIIKQQTISTVRLNFYAHMPEVYWWKKTNLSGGIMVESGSHYVDLLRYLFGEIVAVCATTSKEIAAKSIPDCDIYDSMEAIIKFKSGIIGSIGASHLLNKIYPRNHTLDVYGQNFWLKINLYKLRYENQASCFYKCTDDNDWQSISNQTSKKELLKRESFTFLNAVSQRNPSLIKSSYSDALKSLKVAMAMNVSAEENKFVLF